MLRTKLTSSLENCFVDANINDYPALSRLSALKNERISFQLICTFDSPEDLIRYWYNIKLTGTLAKYATVREVRSVPVTLAVPLAIRESVFDNYLRTEPGLYPDLIMPLRYNDRISAVRGLLSTAWIEIDLREHADEIEAGEAELAVELICGDVAATETLTIDIIDALLPPQETTVTQWFHCDCLANYYNCEVWSEEHWRIVENFARTAKSNGINLLLTPLLTPSLDTAVGGERTTNQLVKITKTGDDYEFDFSLVDRWVDMCDSIGIKYFEISHLFTQWGAEHAPKVMATVDGEYKRIFGWETDAISDEYIGFVRKLLVAFIDHMKTHGNDKRCYFHISDEPNRDHLEHYLALKNKLSDILEGYVVMDALSNYEFYSMGATQCPIPSSNHIQPFIDNNTPNLWVYYCIGQWKDVSNRYLSMPSWRNRSIGMQMFKYDVVGFLQWGYNFYNTQFSYDAINPYLDLNGDSWSPAGDTFSVYPAADGTAYESLRIIVFYEALQDIRAMKLAAKLCGKDTVVKAIEDALGKTVAFDVCARSADEMLRVRQAVNDLIKSNI